MSRNKKKAFLPGFERLFKSSEGKKVFPRAMKKELLFEDNLPFVSLQSDDKTIVCRGNELMQCVRVGGLNSMTASDDDIDALKARIAELVSQAGVRYSFYRAFQTAKGSESSCGKGHPRKGPLPEWAETGRSDRPCRRAWRWLE